MCMCSTVEDCEEEGIEKNAKRVGNICQFLILPAWQCEWESQRRISVARLDTPRSSLLASRSALPASPCTISAPVNVPNREHATWKNEIHQPRTLLSNQIYRRIRLTLSSPLISTRRCVCFMLDASLFLSHPIQHTQSVLLPIACYGLFTFACGFKIFSSSSLPRSMLFVLLIFIIYRREMVRLERRALC